MNGKGTLLVRLEACWIQLVNIKDSLINIINMNGSDVIDNKLGLVYTQGDVEIRMS